MGERYGVRNLELAQADLQAIDALGPPILPRFHIIECTGVLHHMADPMDGWRKLLTCLAPGGLMLVGLYSATARRELTALRADPAYPGPGCEDAALRDFRRALMDRPQGELGSSLQDSLDFYTNSDFRDLACHVSERCLTLVEIKQFLDQNDLAFRGFSLDPAILQSFAERYPDDRWPGSLQRWQEFEAENPHTFDAMYVFWCARA
jgi:SAM-dependent methyltransferase